jgi:hypothetical protein
VRKNLVRTANYRGGKNEQHPTTVTTRYSTKKEKQVRRHYLVQGGLGLGHKAKRRAIGRPPARPNPDAAEPSTNPARVSSGPRPACKWNISRARILPSLSYTTLFLSFKRLVKSLILRCLTAYPRRAQRGADGRVCRNLSTLYLNPRSVEACVEVPTGFCHVQQIIRARCIPQSLEQDPPFLAYDAFYTLSTYGFSNDRHSFACHFTCTIILTFNPRIHVNQFAHSLYPQPLRSLLRVEGNITITPLCFPMDGPILDAPCRFPPTVLL